jgi:proteasome activator subunit 3 (PA28 gamma)
LMDIIEKVKPEIWLLIEKCNMVKMLVQLLTPRIESRNNFWGVYSGGDSCRA